MPSAIVETVGGASSNSYVTLAEANAYLDDRSGATAWNSETDDDVKTRALLTACKSLDLLSWAGTRVDTTQALSWPRDYVVNPDIPWAVEEAQDTYYYATTIVPQRVKDAQCELALEILRAGTTDIMTQDTSRFLKRKKTDVLEKEYFEPWHQPQGLARYPQVVDLIQPLLDETKIGATSIVRT